MGWWCTPAMKPAFLKTGPSASSKGATEEGSRTEAAKKKSPGSRGSSPGLSCAVSIAIVGMLICACHFGNRCTNNISQSVTFLQLRSRPAILMRLDKQALRRATAGMEVGLAPRSAALRYSEADPAQRRDDLNLNRVWGRRGLYQN
jgi:hypothetical protein